MRNMTPKKKAEQLIDKFIDVLPSESWHEEAKQCAIIAVELKIDGMKLELGEPIAYWEKVKKEIINLQINA